jgi:hypothetical protein
MAARQQPFISQRCPMPGDRSIHSVTFAGQRTDLIATLEFGLVFVLF